MNFSENLMLHCSADVKIFHGFTRLVSLIIVWVMRATQERSWLWLHKSLQFSLQFEGKDRSHYVAPALYVCE